MKTLFFIFATFVALSSCDKPLICEVSKENIIGSFILAAAAYRSNSTATEIDYYDVISPDPCDKDDILTFKSDGSFELVDAGLKCSPENNDSGVWTLNGRTLTSDGDKTPIVDFECNKRIVFSITDVYISGDKLKMTYTKQ